jgi:hypothetical protein
MYTPATQFPSDINIFQWSQPTDPNPRLAAPISASDTTLLFTSAPKDKDGNIISGHFLGGVKNSAGYTETFYVPVGGMSADGLTASGVVRGIRLAGLDYTTAGTGLAQDFGQDSPVYCNVSAVLFQMMIGAMQGTLASGGPDWTLGDGTDVDITVYADNGDTNVPFFRYDAATNQWVFSNDGISSTPFGTGAGVTGGDGISVTAGDIDIDLTDTTIFVSTSSGIADSGKVPRLDATGKVASGFIDISGVLVNTTRDNRTFNEAISVKQGVSWKGNGRVAKCDGNDINPAMLFAGVANASGNAGDSTECVIPGPLVTIPTLVADLPYARLWTGQTQTAQDTATDTIYDANWYGQTFTPEVGETNVGSVIANMTVTGSPSGTYRCSIFATTGGLPTGSALGTADLLTSAMANGSNEFIFTTPVTVAVGSLYAIVIKEQAGTINSTNCYSWNYQSGGSTYLNGTRLSSANSGGTWVSDGTTDRAFTVKYRGIYGEPVFMSDTAGAFSLVPSTSYAEKVGVATSLTTMILERGPKNIYATYSFTANSNATVSTEITIGFRAFMVFASVNNGSTRGSMGQWMNSGSSWSMENTGLNTETNAGTGNFGSFADQKIAYLTTKNLATDANYVTATFDVTGTSANTITVRRIIAITGSGSASLTVKLHILGY